MPAIYPQDWDDPYSQPPRPLVPGVPPPFLPGASTMAGHDPNQDSWSGADWWRTPLPAETETPQVAASGTAGIGQTAQPQPDTSTSGPGAAAGAAMNGTQRHPPPGSAAQAAAVEPQGPPTLQRRGPPPGAAQSPQSAAPTVDLSPQIQQAAESIGNRPTAPKDNWAQRLGMAVLSMTKLSPYAMQILHPTYSRQMGQYEQAQKDLQGLTASQEALGRANWAQAQADESKGRYLRVGNGVFDQATGQWITQPTDKSQLVPIDPALAAKHGLQLNRLPDGSYMVPYQTYDSIAKLEQGSQETQEITADRAKQLGIAPDSDGKYRIRKEGISQYVGDSLKPPAQPTAEQAKMAQQNAIAKMELGGEHIPASVFTDEAKLITAIRASKVLSDPEKAAAVGFQGINTSPASQGTTANIRVQGMEQSRIQTYIDTATGQAYTMNAEEFNAANRAAPGRYVQSTISAPTMQRQATFTEIQNAVDQAKDAIPKLANLDAGSRIEMANALADESGGRMSTFLNGAVQSTMTPEQRSAVIAIKNLNESALALRSVQGMGQGSDTMRHAIISTLPGATSANVPYMMDQLKTFERSLQILHKGTPGLGGPSQGVSAGNPSTGGGRGQSAQGGYQIGHLYNGMTYLGGDPKQPSSWRK